MTAHASLALDVPACTSCDLCVTECPAWCIRLDSHMSESMSGGRRRIKVLDALVVDYGLCIFCGICVDVCPFDALSWSAEPVPATSVRADLRVDLADVPPPHA